MLEAIAISALATKLRALKLSPVRSDGRSELPRSPSSSRLLPRSSMAPMIPHVRRGRRASADQVPACTTCRLAKGKDDSRAFGYWPPKILS